MTEEFAQTLCSKQELSEVAALPQLIKAEPIEDILDAAMVIRSSQFSYWAAIEVERQKPRSAAKRKAMRTLLRKEYLAREMCRILTTELELRLSV